MSPETILVKEQGESAVTSTNRDEVNREMGLQCIFKGSSLKLTDTHLKAVLLFTLYIFVTVVV